jgi:hypothetical protein
MCRLLSFVDKWRVIRSEVEISASMGGLSVNFRGQ